MKLIDYCVIDYSCVVFEQRTVQERGPPSRGELEPQQIVHRNVPKPGPRCHSVSVEGQGGRQVHHGGANHLRGDVPKENEQRSRAREAQEARKREAIGGFGEGQT